MLSIDSAFDIMDGSGSTGHVDASIHIRVIMPENPNFQTIIMVRPLDLVWTLKQKVLAAVNQELKDPMNYGLYCPPSNMRVGKYLDEERPIKEYPLSGPIGLLEFKYKRRLYKTEVNPLKLKKMHTQAELKLFLELVRKGDIDQMTMKMNRGFDPNFNSIGKGDTPLTLAVTLPRPSATILALVSGGAFVDYRSKDGRTPLHTATLSGNKDAVRILLDLGSSPNYKDAKGLTPLSYAMAKDTPSLCIQWLLQERADIGMKDENGWMEIHHACQNGLSKHLEHLLFYGADRNAQTTDTKETPLHICARFNQEECARLLLFRGADKTLKNSSGQDPSETATTAGHKEISKLISDFKQEQIELFNEVPKYNEKRRGTISMATLRNLQRSRSNPNLLHQLFQQDPVISATVSQAAGYQYVSNGLIPNGVKSATHSRSTANALFPAGTSGSSKSDTPIRKGPERVVELRREPSGYGFILRGPVEPSGSTLSFSPTSDIPARQYVETVEPGSAAEKAGLQAQDFILEINGKNVVLKSHNECVELMRDSGDVLILKVVKVQSLDESNSKQALADDANVTVHSTATTADATSVNSEATNDSAAMALVGLEALENLDATLDSYDSKGVADVKDVQVEALTLVPPAEFTSEDEPIADLPLPPPPPVNFDDTYGAVSAEDDELLKLVKVSYGSKADTSQETLSSEAEQSLPTEPEQAASSASNKKIDEGEKYSTQSNKATKVTVLAAVSATDSSPSKTRIAELPTVLAVTKATKQKETQVTSSMATTPTKAPPPPPPLLSPMATEPTKAPPPPPPLPPPELLMTGTLSRASVNTATTSDGWKASSSSGQTSTLKREMDENRKREDSHAVLMAAILKRKNVLDVTDSEQMAESIAVRVDRTKDRQKIVYRGDKTKEVQSPPTGISGVGLLAAEAGQATSLSPTADDDASQAGFSAEAEKIRQAFLLKKSAVAASKEVQKEKTSLTMVQGESGDKNGPPDAPKPPPLPMNGTLRREEPKTLDRPKSRPASVAVNNQPVLADVAALIAQKALARKRNEEATASAQQELKTQKAVQSDSKPAQGAAVIVVANNADDVKTSTMANRRSQFEYGNTVLASNSNNSTSKVYTSSAVKNGVASSPPPPAGTVPPSVDVSKTTKRETGSTVSTLSSPKVNATLESKAKSPNRNSKVVSSITVEAQVSPVNNPRQQSSPKKQNAITKPAVVSDLVIPPPVEFATPASSDSGFAEVYPTGTLRSVAKSSQSNSMVFRARGSANSDLSTPKSFRDKALDTWTVADVSEWLESLEYGSYSPGFASKKITGPQLAQMKQEQMEAYGVSNPLHRIKMEKEIKKFSGKK